MSDKPTLFWFGDGAANTGFGIVSLAANTVIPTKIITFSFIQIINLEK